jgi:predicted nucleotidyltransferase
MRKSPILDALFPGVRGSILAATLLRPDKEWYLSELASFLNLRPSSLQREVESLGKAGILEQRKDGGRVYLRPDARSPVLSDLRQLFEKTAGTTFVLRDALDELDGRIRIAFLYGSMARSAESSQSDIDLLVIGEAGLSDLAPHLRRAERLLARPVNVTVFSVAEFRRKARGRDHFLSRVLESDKVFVKGNALELEAIAREGRPEGS